MKVELTVELRLINGRIGVKILNQQGGSLIDGKARRPFEQNEREGFLASTLELRGGKRCSLLELTQAFRTQDSEILKAVLTGETQVKLGELLTRGLFGDDAEQHVLFARAFGGVVEDRRTCADRPARLLLRAQPGAEDLLMLPWRAMAFRGRTLRTSYDWTFAVSGQPRRRRAVTFLRPCTVLLLVPDRGRPAGAGELAATGGAEHAERLTARLKELDAGFEIERVTHATAVRDRLRDLSPAVIYWYGHARLEGDLLQLLFDDEPMSVRALADTLQRLAEPPALVYLNGCSTGAGSFLSGPYQLEPLVPAVVANHVRASIAESRALALPFFDALFREGLSPEEALEKACDADVVDRDSWPWLAPMVWASHGGWNPGFHRPASRADFERYFLRLNRYDQRGKALHLLEDLLDGSLAGTRALSLVYLGGKGNHVERFGDELHDDLRRKLKGRARLLVPPGPLPPLTHAGAASPEGLRAMLAAAYGTREDRIPQAVAMQAGRLGHGAPPVLWLDWGAHPRPGVPALSQEDMLAWQTALHDELPRHLPKGISAMALLGWEVPEVEATFERFSGALASENLLSGEVLIEVLAPLGDVTYQDLMRLFRENAESLNISQDLWAPVARCIVGERTAAPYAPTVALLAEAAVLRWRTFVRQRGGGRR